MLNYVEIKANIGDNAGIMRDVHGPVGVSIDVLVQYILDHAPSKSDGHNVVVQHLDTEVFGPGFLVIVHAEMITGHAPISD